MKQTGVKEEGHLQQNLWIGVFTTRPAEEPTVSCPLTGGGIAEDSSAGEGVAMTRCEEPGEGGKQGKQRWQGQLCSNEQQPVT
jgi:hypothetical protein